MRSRGFTLVEVLVALVILALIAAMSWQGVDAMVRTREVAQSRLTSTLRLQTVVAQLEADVGAVVDTQMVEALRFDGASLRLTRQAPNGVQLVVWSLRAGVWQRWASPAYTGAADLREAWMRSLQFLGNEPGQLRALEGVASWQMYCFRSGSWSNCQSTGNLVPQQPPASAPGGGQGGGQGSGPSGGGNPPPGPGGQQRQALPTGVRVTVTMAEGSGLSGRLTRDLIVAPQ